ncbi:MAG: efflux RND transporter periplasmic adaptor subunit [Candidatus Moranbacteria bacterium]|nr:efflux RND transporter periplasmic adaptor subunit [Candidatus Moranbacteria bacterium]
MKMKKSHIAIIAIIVIAGGYYWYKSTHTASTAITYKTTAAQKGMLTSSVSGSGNVVVDQSVNIDPTITGTVANLAVNIGDPVKKGQTLFTIVNEQLSISAASAKNAYLQSQQAVETSKASEKQAQYNYDHNKAGSAQERILNNQLQAAKQSLEVSKENVNVSQEKYQSALSDAGKRNVTAPSDGTVNAINIKNGDDLSKLSSGSSRSVPMIIGDLGTMKAQVQINEVDVPNVALGQKVMMTFNSVAGLTTSGKIEKMDSLGTIAQGVVTYNATISFDSLDARIKPGMSVSASIITSVKQDVITVPNSAVKKQGNGNYVEVLNSGETSPQQVTVQIGAVNNTDTEIVSGISVGDPVVTRTINPNATTSTSTQSGGARLPGIGGGGRFGG